MARVQRKVAISYFNPFLIAYVFMGKEMPNVCASSGKVETNHLVNALL